MAQDDIETFEDELIAEALSLGIEVPYCLRYFRFRRQKETRRDISTDGEK